jgi:hypothetical protein
MHSVIRAFSFILFDFKSVIFLLRKRVSFDIFRYPFFYKTINTDGLVKSFWIIAAWHRSKAHIPPLKISGIKNRYNAVAPPCGIYDAINTGRYITCFIKSIQHLLLQ